MTEQTMLRITWVLQLSMLVMALALLIVGEYVQVPASLVSFSITILPAIHKRSVRVVLPVWLVLWIVVALFLHSIGGAFGFYDSLHFWDHITHAISASLIAALGFVVVLTIDFFFESIHLPRQFVAFFVLMFGMAVGVFWEIMEFTQDQLVGTSLQYTSRGRQSQAVRLLSFAGAAAAESSAASDVFDIGLDLDALSSEMEAAGAAGSDFVDLGLDFSDLGMDEGAKKKPEQAVAEAADLDFNFDLGGVAETPTEQGDSPSLDFDFSAFGGEAESASVTSEPLKAEESSLGGLDFDLGSMAEEASMLKPEAVRKLVAGLKDNDSAVRYWAALGLLMRGSNAVNSARQQLVPLLNDPAPAVRVVAAGALGRFGAESEQQLAAETLKALAAPDKNGAYVSMMALNKEDDP